MASITEIAYGKCVIDSRRHLEEPGPSGWLSIRYQVCLAQPFVEEAVNIRRSIEDFSPDPDSKGAWLFTAMPLGVEGAGGKSQVFSGLIKGH